MKVEGHQTKHTQTHLLAQYNQLSDNSYKWLLSRKAIQLNIDLQQEKNAPVPYQGPVKHYLTKCDDAKKL